MKKIAILGSTGMIGSGITQVLAKFDQNLYELNRTGIAVVKGNNHSKFAIEEDISILEKKLRGIDYVINATGVIRHKIIGNNPISVENAIKVNSDFPKSLTELSTILGFRVIQVATDCVYSGNKGNYSETDSFDPIDVYGQTKASGEISHPNLLNLRVSVVGRELLTSVELLSWVLSHSNNASINGFSNHIWNGVTVLQLSKLINGIINNDYFTPGTHHLIPSGKVSKYELIKLIADLGDRSDLTVDFASADIKVDRTLATNDINRNKTYWNLAGYTSIPTIEDMIAEYMDLTGQTNHL